MSWPLRGAALWRTWLAWPAGLTPGAAEGPTQPGTSAGAAPALPAAR